MTIQAVTSTLTTQGDLSDPFQNQKGGPFNLKISGTFTGVLQLERAFAKGDDLPQPADWQIVTLDQSGTLAEFTTEINSPCYDPEEGVWYRIVLDTLSSGGPIEVRFSQ